MRLGGLLAAALLASATIAMAEPAPTADAPASAPDRRSEAIYPPQQITIRFDHQLHLASGASCKTCHAGAATSSRATDRLLPPGSTCDRCHAGAASGHADLDAVRMAEGDRATSCASCHVGWQPEHGNAVARMDMPRANLVFDHARHAARNIACARCHGDMTKVGLATRAELPTMRMCFSCHAVGDAAARGAASSACETCHLGWGSRSRDGLTAPVAVAGASRDRGGKIRTVFASGVLTPPRWLHGAEHTPDFLERHKMVAGNDSAFCANCHGEDFCTACHDGRTRPRSIHPGDYLQMHPIEARLATSKCTSCHQAQSFCVGCHMRLGITMSGPPDARSAARFHPPKGVWSDPPRTPMHHAVEAQRNLTACVGCHIERDCVVCHGARNGGAGAGFSPHRPGFADRCAGELRRNPRPCFACHGEGGLTAGDPDLARCR